MYFLRHLALALPLATALGCNSAAGPGPSGDKADDLCTTVDHEIALTLDFGERTFTQPVAAVPHPSETDFWFIAEQRGIIWRMVRGDGVITPRRFGDLRSLVNSEPTEAGLLGIALHPDFDQNGFVFASYTAASADSPANLQSRISRFRTDDGGLTLDPDTEEILLRVEQPQENHNGGQIAFGPDGLLYLGLGDGGGAGDPEGNAQNTDSLLGKVLRIDVDTPDGNTPYSIPADNPFASTGGRPEIYAWGLRNPWRFSFDRETGALWLGDVGQDDVEEIDQITLGGNYGWNVREGDECFGSSPCDSFDEPVATYRHDEGASVTGGFRYRGSQIPSLTGSYVFSDAATGTIWALSQETPDGPWLRRTLMLEAGAIVSFAEGTGGELFAIDYSSGHIFAIGEGTSETICPPDGGTPDGIPSPDAAPITSFQQLYDEIISVQCAPCHTQRALGGLRMVDADAAFDNLIDVPAETVDCQGRTRVIAGDKDNSLFFSKVSGINLCGPPMPFGGVISDASIDAIGQWIEAGAQR